jgi:hypothetical protein
MDMSNREMDGMGRVGAPVTVVEFAPPQKLKLEGDSGEAMVQWRRRPNGKVAIVSIDGVSLGAEAPPAMPDRSMEAEEPGEDEEEGMTG